MGWQVKVEVVPGLLRFIPPSYIGSSAFFEVFSHSIPGKFAKFTRVEAPAGYYWEGFWLKSGPAPVTPPPTVDPPEEEEEEEDDDPPDCADDEDDL